ncbi:unnamed protein product [Scytosiphon promiscuus]
MGLETPRRVMFGAPMAAEFNHLSPSNRLTPMPSRDAKTLFPLEKQQEAETEDEDEDTAANSAQLAEWEGVEPMDTDEMEFDDFDGVNEDGGSGGGMFSPEQADAAPSKASPSPRNRRRDSLALKSPVRKSIAAYSQGVRTTSMAEPLSPYDSDVDPQQRLRDNLNASISEYIAAKTGNAAPTAAAPAASPEKRSNRSFSISNSQLHPLNDSDSSLELTGTFSNTDDFRAPPPARDSLAGPIGGAEGGVSAASRSKRGGATYPDGSRDGGGEAAEADDRMNLDDSSELESTLHGASIRDAVSPAPDSSRRLSTGSLLSLIGDVDEFEEEVRSQASGPKTESEEGGGGGDAEKEQVLSPPPGASGAEVGQTGESDGPDTANPLGQSWGSRPSLTFGQDAVERLPTVVEEMSPGSLLSSDQSQAQSRRWESLGGSSTESTFELQADLMDSMVELDSASAPVRKGAPPLVGGPPSSPTEELSGALEGFMGDPAPTTAAAATGPAAGEFEPGGWWSGSGWRAPEAEGAAAVEHRWSPREPHRGAGGRSHGLRGRSRSPQAFCAGAEG